MRHYVQLRGISTIIVQTKVVPKPEDVFFRLFLDCSLGDRVALPFGLVPGAAGDGMADSIAACCMVRTFIFFCEPAEPAPPNFKSVERRQIQSREDLVRSTWRKCCYLSTVRSKRLFAREQGRLCKLLLLSSPRAVKSFVICPVAEARDGHHTAEASRSWSYILLSL